MAQAFTPRKGVARHCPVHQDLAEEGNEGVQAAQVPSTQGSALPAHHQAAWRGQPPPDGGVERLQLLLGTLCPQHSPEAMFGVPGLLKEPLNHPQLLSRIPAREQAVPLLADTDEEP